MSQGGTLWDRGCGVLRTVTIVVGLAVLSAGLAGCGADGIPFVEAQACASWVSFDTDDERAASAEAVVVTRALEPDGTERILGYDANAYVVTVDVAEKGDLRAGDTIRVGSTADNCSDRPYGDGDPMLGDGPLRLFLSEDEGQWRTLTPFDGVRPAP